MAVPDPRVSSRPGLGLLQARKTGLEVGLQILEVLEPDMEPQRGAAGLPLGGGPVGRAVEGDDEALESAGDSTALAAGQRVGRKDGLSKTWQSRIANGVRGRILNDGTRDTGCGLKVFRRDVYLSLPYFDALHRFMPALVKREGYGVTHVDVVDRPRLAGRSNYGMFDRLWVGLLDLAGVWWLIRRRRRVPRASEVH